MKLKGESAPATPRITGRSKRAVTGLAVAAPRIVTGRKTTCCIAGCSARKTPSISSTRRLWWAYGKSSFPRRGRSSVRSGGLSGW